VTDIKLFTPAEADQTLPLVKRIVDDILVTGKVIREISQRVGAGSEKDPEIIRHMDQLEELFQELERIGCTYKDWNFSVGLVDFPGTLDGREVMLCWRSDEDGVKYFHELDEGFAGRKPVPGK
jgi:hypothetical protein